MQKLKFKQEGAFIKEGDDFISYKWSGFSEDITLVLKGNDYSLIEDEVEVNEEFYLNGTKVEKFYSQFPEVETLGKLNYNLAII